MVSIKFWHGKFSRPATGTSALRMLLRLTAVNPRRDHKPQSRSQSFVPLDQRSENESSGSIHFEITMGNNRILVIRFTAQSQSASISCYGACLKWLLPELSFSDRWSRGTKLWERDCTSPGKYPDG